MTETPNAVSQKVANCVVDPLLQKVDSTLNPKILKIQSQHQKAFRKKSILLTLIQAMAGCRALQGMANQRRIQMMTRNLLDPAQTLILRLNKKTTRQRKCHITKVYG